MVSPSRTSVRPRRQSLWTTSAAKELQAPPLLPLEPIINRHLATAQAALAKELEAIVTEREGYVQELAGNLQLDQEERNRVMRGISSGSVAMTEQERARMMRGLSTGSSSETERARMMRGISSGSVSEMDKRRGRLTPGSEEAKPSARRVAPAASMESLDERENSDDAEDEGPQAGLGKLTSELPILKNGGNNNKGLTSVVCTTPEGQVASVTPSMTHTDTSILPGVIEQHSRETKRQASTLSGKSARTNGQPHFEMWSTWKVSQTTFADRILPSMSSASPLTANSANSMEMLGKRSSVSSTPRGLIHPSSTLSVTWNLLFMAVLCYELIALPLRVFSPPEGGLLGALGLSAVLFWTFDVAFSMSVGHYTKEGKLIMARRLILSKYLRSWMVPDILIVGLDWVLLVVEFSKGQGHASNNMGSWTSVLRVGKSLRYVRVLRILRLLRLKKLGESLTILDELISSEYFSILQNVFANMIGIMVISHFLGCFWYYVGSNQVEGKPSWVEVYGLSSADWGYQYVTSLHWSLTQITPGSMEIQPQNAPERVYAVVVLVLGIIVFSSIVSSITAAVNNLKSIGARYERQRGLLRRFFREQGISKGLVTRVTRYSDNILRPQQKKVSAHEVDILRLLPESLHMEVMLEIYFRYVEVHPLFKAVCVQNKAVMQKICCQLETINIPKDDVLFVPGETATAMYFVIRGQFAYGFLQAVCLLVEPGTWFCEPVLWTPWVHQGSMEATHDSELVMLDSKRFQDVVSRHRADMWLVRKYASEFVRKMNELAASCVGESADTPWDSTEEDEPTLSDIMSIESAIRLLDPDKLKRCRDGRKSARLSTGGRTPAKDPSDQSSRMHTPVIGQVEAFSPTDYVP